MLLNKRHELYQLWRRHTSWWFLNYTTRVSYFSVTHSNPSCKLKMYHPQLLQISCDGTFTGDVEESRRHHDTCCRLLHSADSLVRVYLLLAITTAIPLVVFTIYFVLFQASLQALSLSLSLCLSVCLSLSPSLAKESFDWHMTFDRSAEGSELCSKAPIWSPFAQWILGSFC